MSRSQRNQNPEAEWINRALELHLDVFREAPQLDPFSGGQDDIDVCQHRPGIRGGQSGGVPFAVFKSRRGIGINYRLVKLSGSGIKVVVSTPLQLQLAETGKLRNGHPGTMYCPGATSAPTPNAVGSNNSARVRGRYLVLSSARVSHCYLRLRAAMTPCDKHHQPQLYAALQKFAETLQP